MIRIASASNDVLKISRLHRGRVLLGYTSYRKTQTPNYLVAFIAPLLQSWTSRSAERERPDKGRRVANHTAADSKVPLRRKTVA
jgi:hypothetical protein